MYDLFLNKYCVSEWNYKPTYMVIFIFPSPLPLPIYSFLSFPIFILYVSVLTYGYLYSSVLPLPSLLFFTISLSSIPPFCLLLFPSFLLPSSDLFSSPLPSHSSSHSFYTCRYLRNLIYIESIYLSRVWPRMFYRSGWLRCVGLNTWESCWWVNLDRSYII